MTSDRERRPASNSARRPSAESTPSAGSPGGPPRAPASAYRGLLGTLLLTVVAACGSGEWMVSSLEHLEAGRCRDSLAVLEGVADDEKTEAWYTVFVMSCSSCYEQLGDVSYLDAGARAVAEAKAAYPGRPRPWIDGGFLAEAEGDEATARAEFEQARRLARTILDGGADPGKLADAREQLQIAEKMLARLGPGPGTQASSEAPAAR